MKRYPLFSLFVVLFCTLSFSIQTPDQIKNSILPNGSMMISPNVFWQLEENDEQDEFGKLFYLSNNTVSTKAVSMPRYRGSLSSLKNSTLFAIYLSSLDQALEIKVLDISIKQEPLEGYDIAEITVKDIKLESPHMLFIKQNNSFYFLGISLDNTTENKYRIAIPSQDLNNLVDSTIAKLVLGETTVPPKKEPKAPVQPKAIIKLSDVSAEKNKELRGVVGYSKTNPSIPGIFTAPNRFLISDYVKGVEYGNSTQTTRSRSMLHLSDTGAINNLLTPIILDKYAPISSNRYGPVMFNSTFYVPIPLKTGAKTPNYVFKKFVMTEEMWKFETEKLDLPKNHLRSFKVPLLAYINNKVRTVGMLSTQNGLVEKWFIFAPNVVQKHQNQLAQSLLQPKRAEELISKEAIPHDVLVTNVKLHKSVLQPVFKMVEKEYIKGKNIYVFNKEKQLAVKFRIYNLPDNKFLDLYSYYIAKHFDKNTSHHLFVKTQDKKSWLAIGKLNIDQNRKQTLQFHYGKLPPVDYLHHVTGQIYISPLQYIDRFDKNNIQANSSEIIFIKSTLIDAPKEQKIHGTNTPKEYLGKTFVFYYKTKEDDKKHVKIKLDKYTLAEEKHGWFSQQSSIKLPVLLDFKEYLPFVYILEGNKEVLVGFIIKSDETTFLYLFNKTAQKTFDNLEKTLSQFEKDGHRVLVTGFDKIEKSNKHDYNIFIKPNIIYYSFPYLLGNEKPKIEQLGGNWGSQKKLKHLSRIVFKSNPEKLDKNLAYATVKPIQDPSILSNKEIYMTIDEKGLKLVKFKLPEVSNKAQTDLIFPWINNLYLYGESTIYIKEGNTFKLVGLAHKKYLVPLNYFKVKWITPEVYGEMTK